MLITARVTPDLAYSRIESFIAWQQRMGVVATFDQMTSLFRLWRDERSPGHALAQRFLAPSSRCSNDAGRGAPGRQFDVPASALPSGLTISPIAAHIQGTLLPPARLNALRGLDAAHGGTFSRQLEQIDGRASGAFSSVPVPATAYRAKSGPRKTVH
jgi:hypothetical protein